MTPSGPVERRVPLHFSARSSAAETHTNLSAVRSDGPVLWVAGDETATIERLRADDPESPQAYGEQRTFALADLVTLPGPADEEADIEGLARQEGWLWAVGSHSLRRKNVKAKHSDSKGVKRLAKVEGQANRQILARLPLGLDDDGLPAPAATVTSNGQTRHAAVLGGPGQQSLRDLLADDPHLGPFLALPGKDNGLDVEGIAVRDDRLYLGLRGPVLRGWAVVLEVRPYVNPAEPTRLRLEPLAEDGTPYVKHFLDLGGLGVRDLCPQGQDLLVLAGPSMDLDGPVRVLRWHGAVSDDSPGIVRGAEISRELDLPYGEGDDHAEGIGLLGPDGGEQRLLVVYDSPSPERMEADGAVLADVVRLPERGPRVEETE